MKKPEKPTMKLAILAHCHQCCGYFSDGKQDCLNPSCPLYTFFPQGKLDPDLGWLEFNPKKVGKVKWVDSGRKMTQEHLDALARGREKARENREK